MSPDPKVLVLGSDIKRRGIRAVPWGEIPPDLHVADFDAVIINMAAFEDDTDLAEAMSATVLPSASDFAVGLFGGAHLIGIGNPSNQLGPPPQTVQQALTSPQSRTDWWSPLRLDVVQAPADVTDVDWQLQDYMELVRTTTWYFDFVVVRGTAPAACNLAPVHPQADRVTWSIEAAARTRFGKLAALQLQVSAWSTAVGNYTPGGNGIVGSQGTLTFLPRPTDVDVDVAIGSLLAKTLGLLVEDTRPTWVSRYRLPDHEAAELAVQEATAKLEVAQEALSRREAQAADEDRLQRLLYETGEEALEPVVRDALRRLGATVEDPTTRGREDGRMTDPLGRIAMLEVKGRRHALKLSDVRELDQWVRDELPDAEYKGVLIANTYNDTDPSERPSPFPDNALTLARKTGICLLTTTQLYEALARSQRDQLDLERFFAALYETDGSCDLPELNS